MSDSHETNQTIVDPAFFKRALGDGRPRADSRSTFKQGLSRIRHVIRKEFIQIVRNKQNFRILLIAPIFQLILFGYAVRLDVKEVATVVVDMDRSIVSRNLVESFTRSGYFVIKEYLTSYDQADYYLERGEATVALLIPPDLERRVKADQTTQIGILVDGVDTTTAGTVSGWAQAIIQGYAFELMQEDIQWARGLRFTLNSPTLLIPSISAKPRAWFNPNLDSKDYFVPGTLVLILMFLAVTSTAMVIVREKEKGTIEQIMVTPISRVELIVGKTIPCFIIAVANLASMTVLAFLVFQPIFKGSLFIFFMGGIAFTITCLGMGMTLSVFCRTQQQAVLLTFFVMQPASILSGFVFPIDNMPTVIQYVTYLNPLRYYIVIVREVFLKGVGWDLLWPQFVPLVVMGVGYILLSSFLFKKKID
jgi:ABC-2 type transport system permease protein